MFVLVIHFMPQNHQEMEKKTKTQAYTYIIMFLFYYVPAVTPEHIFPEVMIYGEQLSALLIIQYPRTTML